MKKVIVISFKNGVVAVYSGLKAACYSNGWEYWTLARKPFPFRYKGALIEKQTVYKARDNHKIKFTYEMNEAARLEKEQKKEIFNLKHRVTALKTEIKTLKSNFIIQKKDI